MGGSGGTGGMLGREVGVAGVSGPAVAQRQTPSHTVNQTGPFCLQRNPQQRDNPSTKQNKFAHNCCFDATAKLFFKIIKINK
jgi:hypothetical protein